MSYGFPCALKPFQLDFSIFRIQVQYVSKLALSNAHLVSSKHLISTSLNGFFKAL